MNSQDYYDEDRDTSWLDRNVRPVKMGFHTLLRTPRKTKPKKHKHKRKEKRR